jgi:hypothetical protein
VKEDHVAGPLPGRLFHEPVAFISCVALRAHDLPAERPASHRFKIARRMHGVLRALLTRRGRN